MKIRFSSNLAWLKFIDLSAKDHDICTGIDIDVSGDIVKVYEAASRQLS